MWTWSLSEIKNTNKLCIWCKSSAVAGTCRTETWHEHIKQRWTSTTWLLRQIDDHNNQFRNHAFIIYLTKMKNNMKNTPCSGKIIFNQKNSKSGQAVMINKTISQILDNALRVNSLRAHGRKFIHGCCISSGSWSLDIQGQNNHGQKTSS